jgi:hypothetical protein
MLKEITLQVPEELGNELENYQGQLVEILELGLLEIKSSEKNIFEDENAILELLASQPEPEKIIALRPSPELQSRINELVQKSKNNQSTAKEEAELERYFALEHLVRLAKAHASKKFPR